MQTKDIEDELTLLTFFIILPIKLKQYVTHIYLYIERNPYMMVYVFHEKSKSQTHRGYQVYPTFIAPGQCMSDGLQ